MYQRPPRFILDPVSTLPKPRPYVDGYHKQQGVVQQQVQQGSSLGQQQAQQQQQLQSQQQHPGGQRLIAQRRGSHPGMQLMGGEGGGGVGGGGGGGVSIGVGVGGGVRTESPRHSPRELSFPMAEVSHLRFEPQPSTPPAPLHPAPPPPPQQQSSEDEEEWSCPHPISPHPISPARTLGSPRGSVTVMSPSSMRGPASCSAFPVSSPRPQNMLCPQGYLHAEHAQSWPSINVSSHYSIG